MRDGALQVRQREKKELSKRTILIADDDPGVIVGLRAILEGAGYRVVAANNGREAVLFLRREPAQCVLLDVFMPDQDGIETLREIKEAFPGTRVLIMSGSGMPGGYDFLNAAIKLGADGAMRKPVTTSQLLALVNSRPTLLPVS